MVLGRVYGHDGSCARTRLHAVVAVAQECVWVPWPSGSHAVGWSLLNAVSMNAKDLSSNPVAAPSASTAQSRAAEAVLNELMDRYARGDDSAFGELHEHLGPRVRRFLLRLTSNSAVAEELAQDAFLRMHRARGSFTPGGAALPWVYTVTRNVFLDHERKRKVQSAVVLNEALAQVHPDSVSRQPDNVLDSRRALEQVREALARMPVSQREAFVLLRFEGLSVADAAEVLGTTEASAKARAFRAYEAIRQATKTVENEGKE